MPEKPLLLPFPRHLQFAEGAFAGDPFPSLSTVIDETIAPQGYRLEITPGGVTISHSSAEGAHYGSLILTQLIAQYGSILPALTVDDAPDFTRRGVMLDCSRDRVPTMETLYRLVDKLSAWRINELQLYMEHTFAYEEHREVWQSASPFTPTEIRALDAYCRERFIDLVPCQSSLGHLERWLKHPQYAHLAEKPDGFVAPWDKMALQRPPSTLDPSNPQSFELVASLFDELVPNFTSRYVNICDDEPFELGMGNNKQLVAEVGGRVYLDYLLKVYAHIAGTGRHVQFWADIITQHPELVPELPKDIIPLVWGYESNEPSELQCQMVSASGLNFYVCPGTSSWNCLVGRTDNAVGNLRTAAEHGLKYGAVGYLITDWGDCGHWQALPVSYLGFAYGAGVSWCYETNAAMDIPATLDRYAFEDSAGVMGQVAYDLGNLYQLIPLPQFNGQWLFHMLQHSDEMNAARYKTYAERAGQGVPTTAARSAIEFIDQQLGQLDRARLGSEDHLIKAEYRLAGELLRHGAKRLLRQFGEAPEADTELRTELCKLIDQQRELWLQRSRPGGLEDSIARFNAALASYQ